MTGPDCAVNRYGGTGTRGTFTCVFKRWLAISISSYNQGRHRPRPLWSNAFLAQGQRSRCWPSCDFRRSGRQHRRDAVFSSQRIIWWHNAAPTSSQDILTSRPHHRPTSLLVCTTPSLTSYKNLTILLSRKRTGRSAESQSRTVGARCVAVARILPRRQHNGPWASRRQLPA